MFVSVPAGAPANTMPTIRQPGRGHGGAPRGQSRNFPPPTQNLMQSQRQQYQPTDNPIPQMAGNWNNPSQPGKHHHHQNGTRHNGTAHNGTLTSQNGTYLRQNQSVQSRSQSNSNYNRHRIGIQDSRNGQNQPSSGRNTPASGYIPPNQPTNQFRLPMNTHNQGDSSYQNDFSKALK